MGLQAKPIETAGRSGAPSPTPQRTGDLGTKEVHGRVFDAEHGPSAGVAGIQVRYWAPGGYGFGGLQMWRARDPIPIGLPSGFCNGDSDHDLAVTVDELVVGVGIALEMHHRNQCIEMDANADARVSIEELVAAVQNALRGCNGASATPSPTPERPLWRSDGDATFRRMPRNGQRSGFVSARARGTATRSTSPSSASVPPVRRGVPVRDRQTASASVSHRGTPVNAVMRRERRAARARRPLGAFAGWTPSRSIEGAEVPVAARLIAAAVAGHGTARPPRATDVAAGVAGDGAAVDRQPTFERQVA